MRNNENFYLEKKVIQILKANTDFLAREFVCVGCVCVRKYMFFSDTMSNNINLIFRALNSFLYRALLHSVFLFLFNICIIVCCTTVWKNNNNNNINNNNNNNNSNNNNNNNNNSNNNNSNNNNNNNNNKYNKTTKIVGIAWIGFQKLVYPLFSVIVLTSLQKLVAKISNTWIEPGCSLCFHSWLLRFHL